MKPWNKGCQIAAVYVGTVVGTGFATGKEIVEFFSQYGIWGLFGIAMSGYFFITLGTSLMIKAIDLKARSYEELNEHLFGRRVSKGINLIMLVMLLGFCTVMLSGAGALFEEQLGLPKMAGVVLTIILLIMIMTLGTKGLVAVNTFIVPLLIGFTLLLMFYSVTGDGFMEHLLMVPNQDSIWKAFASPFIYPAMNLAMAQAVLVPLAAEVNDKTAVRIGGILGGSVLTLILISSNLTLVTLPDFTHYEIPMAAVMKGAMLSFYWIYILVIFGEIFTSIVGNVYGAEKQITTYIRARRMYVIIAVVLFCAAFSSFSYSALLGFLYPLFGYISLAFFFLLWRKSAKRYRS
ncbi:YkvI family membrane protein [Jeotgalibacillus proteolyticus]|uniref:YkvI family membrane protein n=1 Tax=Jeotgalibacillus proteolyticus TaxID=2082395 RepID=UPI003CF4C56C